MWVLAILSVKKFEKIKTHYTKPALFSPKFRAKMMWVLSILLVRNIEIEI
jgi:hypothetical protein